MLGNTDYKLKKITGWSDILSASQKLSRTPGGQGKGWIFRGEKSAKYDMKTSLECACCGFGHSYGDIPTLERKMLREFKRRLHHYTTDIPHKKDIIEWLALMQHYGAPTRLLDWTYSFFVAVYFAIELAIEDKCIVWALKMDTFNADNMLNKAEKEQVGHRYEEYLQSDTTLKDGPWLKQCALVDHLIEHPKLWSTQSILLG